MSAPPTFDVIFCYLDPVIIRRSELPNLWHACAKWHAKKFSSHAAFTVVAMIFRTNLAVG
jgi:hypothetical protein